MYKHSLLHNCIVIYIYKAVLDKKHQKAIILLYFFLTILNIIVCLNIEILNEFLSAYMTLHFDEMSILLINGESTDNSVQDNSGSDSTGGGGGSNNPNDLPVVYHPEKGHTDETIGTDPETNTEVPPATVSTSKAPAENISERDKEIASCDHIWSPIQDPYLMGVPCDFSWPVDSHTAGTTEYSLAHSCVNCHAIACEDCHAENDISD